MSRGFDGFEIDDFRDSGWDRDSRSSDREPSRGRNEDWATERSTARKLERLREAGQSLDILNRVSQERSSQTRPPLLREELTFWDVPCTIVIVEGDSKIEKSPCAWPPPPGEEFEPPPQPPTITRRKTHKIRTEHFLLLAKSSRLDSNGPSAHLSVSSVLPAIPSALITETL